MRPEYPRHISVLNIKILTESLPAPIDRIVESNILEIELEPLAYRASTPLTLVPNHPSSQ